MGGAFGGNAMAKGQSRPRTPNGGGESRGGKKICFSMRVRVRVPPSAPSPVETPGPCLASAILWAIGRKLGAFETVPASRGVAAFWVSLPRRVNFMATSWPKRYNLLKLP
jgi:hypothetical protein